MASTRSSRTLLRAILRRGPRVLSCDVISRGRRYDVCVVPHWDVSSALVEAFAKGTDAVGRQAELSWLFRQAGWEHEWRAVRQAA